MLAWILEDAGLAPGFLIGGNPGEFRPSARLGEQPFFVIEADEYDTAFFDKRAKFVHYRPRTLVLNNLEYDHADIYPDVAAIERQFQHLVRTVPGSGRSSATAWMRIWRRCWPPVAGASWKHSRAPAAPQSSGARRRCRRATSGASECSTRDATAAELQWKLIGAHQR